MAKRITTRLLATTLMLLVGLLGVHAASHWHTRASDDLHCQACHVGHAAIPQPAAQGTAFAPVKVARFTPAARSSPNFDAIRIPSVPRAPPA